MKVAEKTPTHDKDKKLLQDPDADCATGNAIGRSNVDRIFPLSTFLFFRQNAEAFLSDSKRMIS